MPVIEEVIKAEISKSMNSNKTVDSQEAQDKFASDLAKTIKDAILSATIVVPAGTPVQVTPASGTGSTIAPTNAQIK